MRNLVFLALSALASLHAVAAPSIDVGSMFEYMDEKKRTLVKHVHNHGDSTAYVKVSLREVVFDESGREQDVADPDGAGILDKKEGLLASPSHLIIPAKGRGGLRLVHLGASERERYYRVTFAPVMPKTLDEFKLDENAAEQYQKSFSAGVNLLVAYGMVVIVRPENTKFNTLVRKEDSQHVIWNQGNSTVIIPHYSACLGEVCENLGLSHLRPGQKKIFPLDGKKYKVFLKEGEHSRSVDLEG
ncbi:hypothetical protein BUE93_06635 [Chromobacterium amazonense]|uniref:Pilus assembly protein n=1 Tax=Chromobacterium amazonense TaxID=1382803 RepID=A0A2S9X713_9NEIS|nr:molecular chaperone [Chromobacterium amazonense]PRP71475.1 hypothetical protein BUE93_06635 [Chromobacterium amazonense]